MRDVGSTDSAARGGSSRPRRPDVGSSNHQRGKVGSTRPPAALTWTEDASDRPDEGEIGRDRAADGGVDRIERFSCAGAMGWRARTKLSQGKADVDSIGSANSIPKCGDGVGNIWPMLNLEMGVIKKKNTFQQFFKTTPETYRLPKEAVQVATFGDVIRTLETLKSSFRAPKSLDPASFSRHDGLFYFTSRTCSRQSNCFWEPSRRRREEDPPPPRRAWRSGGSAASPSPGIGVAAAVLVQVLAPLTRVLDQGLPSPPPVLFWGLVPPPSRPYVGESPRQQLSDHQALAHPVFSVSSLLPPHHRCPQVIWTMEGFVPYTDLLLNDDDYDGLSQDFEARASEPHPSPIMENTPSSKTNQKQKGKNFTKDEDRLLVSAWLNEHREGFAERSQSSLLHRYGGIQEAVSKFCGYLRNIEDANQSGLNVHDRVEKAEKMFQALDRNKKPFQFKHCWVMLRNQPKWHEKLALAALKGSNKKQKVDKESSPGTSNAETSNDQVPRDAPSRPIGKKKAKDALRRGGSDACTQALDNLWVKKEADEENEIKKDERYAKTYAWDVERLLLDKQRLANEDKKLLLEEQKLANEQMMLANEQQNTAIRTDGTFSNTDILIRGVSW
ncbi:hypothetical protein EJB05_03069, partial [Eragrostis curvula]